ncbi:MAG: hypothetical protein DI533_02220 [Cereibacter sphaeroides]|uniref:Gamma-glutamyl kinase n=1 Tax=Cereibacter sphaeroides TaxID=1063 RepID=A0A2W5TU23_CERSP|nr:MAG: hypothetical protein DI533_02220 [Cereibacter sphaeroides]
MLIFWEQGLVLLATPKTGSTAIAAALGPLATVRLGQPTALKHTSVHRYHRFIAPYLAASSGRQFEVVALMREPIDWLGSWYRYRLRADLPDPARSTAHMSFDDFLRAYCSDPQPEFAAVGSQARFLRPRQGAGVDHLFRYENMKGFIRFFEERLETTIDLPRRNVSPQASLDLSPATQILARKQLAPDLALYEGLSR